MTDFRLLFYVLVAAIPAYYINKYLLNWLQPKASARQLVLYLLAVASVAVIYTTVVCWVLVKYVWAVR